MHFRTSNAAWFVILLLSAVCYHTILGHNESTFTTIESQVELLVGEVYNFKIYMAKMVQQLDRIEKRLDEPHDCSDIQLTLGRNFSGVYKVYLYVDGIHRPVDVYCDMTTDGGGWTVFQRRQDGSVDFYRNWRNYSEGFGSLTGEFWLGNDNIHSLTASRQYVLRVDLGDFENNTRYTKYSNFKVGGADDKYRLISLGAYSGNAGYSMNWQYGHKFSTLDQDNDVYNRSCAVVFKGAWWYSSCHMSNLNGLYLRGNHTSYANGVNWYHWTGYFYSLRFTEMKIRPADV